MHICQDEVNAALLAIPFVGFALAWARSAVRHAAARLRRRRPSAEPTSLAEHPYRKPAKRAPAPVRGLLARIREVVRRAVTRLRKQKT